MILTVARSHDVAYLNGIFEMKDPATPIFITQPYMYIANNYDNFNCLVTELPAHSMGLKSLFPLWALTGLKLIKPELVDFPIYTTKEELTTVTLFYDAYYDFGVVGVFLFSAALGLFAAWLMDRAERAENPFWQVFIPRRRFISCCHFLPPGIPIRPPGFILQPRERRWSGWSS